MQRTTCCRIFTPALREYPAASSSRTTHDLREHVRAAKSFRMSILPISPLGWEHIAFNGYYVWPADLLGTEELSARIS
jgi:hypothetical protein